MMPSAIGAGDLDVGEGRYGVKGFNKGLPMKGNSEETQPVVDQGSHLHDDRTRREDVKEEESGRDAFQVPGIGEEGEDLFTGSGDEERSFKMVEHLDLELFVPILRRDRC